MPAFRIRPSFAWQRTVIILLSWRLFLPGADLVAAFRRLSCRIVAIALAFFCLVITSSYSWGVKCMGCSHHERRCSHHEATQADTWGSPVNEFSENCQSFYISRSSKCNEQIVSEIKLIAAAAQARRADRIQREYQPAAFSFHFLPVRLISKNLRL